uniref:SAP30-binding protein n=1 Tax=Kalanchoe fedtschenkoi TaxID=63787 RepID=A0A7N0ZRE8_KALFE
MASRKKETSGISLLSMYNDEDEEMEDAESEEHDAEFENIDAAMGDVVVEEEENVKNSTNNEGGFESDPTPQQPQIAVYAEQQISQKASLNIVDYGHDEVAMSPEAAEEGEIHAAGQYTQDLKLQSENGNLQQKDGTDATHIRSSSNQAISPGLSEQIQASLIVAKDEAVSESHGAEGEDGKTSEGPKDVDPLDLFLPPPPVEKCSQELQDKINKFLALKKSGKSFNKEVRNKKAYRNPDFLLHAVTYQDIDQIGSCFSKDVFDPHGYDKSDYYDEIEADMKCELERKEQERKKNQKVEFIVGGVQPGMVTTAPKPTLPSPVPNLAAGGPSASDAVPREGRQNKKSKWDKVDGDLGSQFPGAQDSKTAVAGAHSALLSANAGAGYTAFAQQKRREAEEKKIQR